MRVDVSSGWLAGVPRIESPNQDDRPENCPVDLLVVHGISLPPGEFGGPFVHRLFTNSLDSGAHPYFAEIAHLRVSSHVFIRRDGQLTQYVPFHRRAWHAGQSCYQGRVACNDFSIGVELEGADDVPYRTAQYLALARLLKALCRAYPDITPDRVAGHSDIAPGRKTDPGPAFDWPCFRRLADTL